MMYCTMMMYVCGERGLGKVVLDNTYSDSCRSAACGSRRVDPLRSGTVAGQRRSEIVVVALKGIALSFFQF